jgi:hypothetical protein
MIKHTQLGDDGRRGVLWPRLASTVELGALSGDVGLD